MLVLAVDLLACSRKFSVMPSSVPEGKSGQQEVAHI